jgi:hypothetical protein
MMKRPWSSDRAVKVRPPTKSSTVAPPAVTQPSIRTIGPECDVAAPELRSGVSVTMRLSRLLVKVTDCVGRVCRVVTPDTRGRQPLQLGDLGVQRRQGQLELDPVGEPAGHRVEARVHIAHREQHLLVEGVERLGCQGRLVGVMTGSRWGRRAGLRAAWPGTGRGWDRSSRPAYRALLRALRNRGGRRRR